MKCYCLLISILLGVERCREAVQGVLLQGHDSSMTVPSIHTAAHPLHHNYGRYLNISKLSPTHMNNDTAFRQSAAPACMVRR
jgi:hypothetical protein